MSFVLGSTKVVEADVIFGPINYFLIALFIVVMVTIIASVAVGVVRDQLRRRGRDFSWMTRAIENYVIRPRDDVTASTEVECTGGNEPEDELVSITESV